MIFYCSSFDTENRPRQFERICLKRHLKNSPLILKWIKICIWLNYLIYILIYLLMFLCGCQFILNLCQYPLNISEGLNFFWSTLGAKCLLLQSAGEWAESLFPPVTIVCVHQTNLKTSHMSADIARLVISQLIINCVGIQNKYVNGPWLVFKRILKTLNA